MYRMIGVDLTSTSTTAQVPLGSEFSRESPDGYGEQTWIYVKNAEAATNFVVGKGVARKAGVTDRQCVISPTSCMLSRMVGVAQHTIPFGEYGWILREGVGLVIADTGGLSADTSIIPGNAVAGAFDDAAATAAHVGCSLAATLATATGLAYIACQG